MSNTQRPQRFAERYFHETGTLMLMAETYVILIRLSDGFAQRFTYQQLGFES